MNFQFKLPVRTAYLSIVAHFARQSSFKLATTNRALATAPGIGIMSSQAIPSDNAWRGRMLQSGRPASKNGPAPLAGRVLPSRGVCARAAEWRRAEARHADSQPGDTPARQGFNVSNSATALSARFGARFRFGDRGRNSRPAGRRCPAPPTHLPRMICRLKAVPQNIMRRLSSSRSPETT